MDSRFIELPDRYEKAKQNQLLNAEVEAFLVNGGQITVLPDYTPKARPEHTVKSKRIMGLPNKKPQTVSKCITNNPGFAEQRRQSFIDFLTKSKRCCSSAEIRQRFMITDPVKFSETINRSRGKDLIRWKRAFCPEVRANVNFFWVEK